MKTPADAGARAFLQVILEQHELSSVLQAIADYARQKGEAHNKLQGQALADRYWFAAGELARLRCHTKLEGL